MVAENQVHIPRKPPFSVCEVGHVVNPSLTKLVFASAAVFFQNQKQKQKKKTPQAVMFQVFRSNCHIHVTHSSQSDVMLGGNQILLLPFLIDTKF